MHVAQPKPRRGGVLINPRSRSRELSNHDRRSLVGLVTRPAPASTSGRRTATTRSPEYSSYYWGKAAALMRLLTLLPKQANHQPGGTTEEKYVHLLNRFFEEVKPADAVQLHDA